MNKSVSTSDFKIPSSAGLNNPLRESLSKSIVNQKINSAVSKVGQVKEKGAPTPRKSVREGSANKTLGKIEKDTTALANKRQSVIIPKFSEKLKANVKDKVAEAQKTPMKDKIDPKKGSNPKSKSGLGGKIEA